jgi:UDP-glucose 4-epimerase
MKKVLILGGTGYIGTNLAINLTKFYDVTVTGRKDLNIFLQKHSNIKFLKLKLSNTEIIKSIVENYDIFIMLIPNLQPHQFSQNPGDDMIEIINPSETLFKLLALAKKKLIFSSTGGAVYGDSGMKMSKESDLCHPINQYGKYKLKLENILEGIWKETEFDVDILRISNPYGGHFFNYFTSGFINTALSKIKVNAPLNIWGNGLQIRDFIHINDVCEYIRRSIEIKGFNLINIGTGVGHSLVSTCRLIAKVNAVQIDIHFDDDYLELVPYNVLYTKKSMEILGYTPRLDLKSGIRLEKL